MFRHANIEEGAAPANEFELLPDGNFRFRGDLYRAINDREHPALRRDDGIPYNPDLFYTTLEGKVRSRHPYIVRYNGEDSGLTIQIGARKIGDDDVYTPNESLNDVWMVMPCYANNHLYGAKQSFATVNELHKNLVLKPIDVSRVLLSIRPDYLRAVKCLKLRLIPINHIPLSISICPNLIEVQLISCGLTSFPDCLNTLDLSYLDLSYNPGLEEIPYYFLKFKAPQLREFKLRNTGVKSLWMPGWSRNPAIDIDISDTPMRQLTVSEEKLYGSTDEWYGTWANDSPGTHSGLIGIIFRKSVEPVIKAAIAFLGVQRRGVIPNLPKDIARFIAHKINCTTGFTAWSGLVYSECHKIKKQRINDD